jgi:hypothetical protein
LELGRSWRATSGLTEKEEELWFRSWFGHGQCWFTSMTSNSKKGGQQNRASANFRAAKADTVGGFHFRVDPYE